MGDKNYVSAESPEQRPGPYLAKVMSHLDSTYMGMLQVQILRPTGNTGSDGQTHQVKYMSPFWGQTSADFIKEDPDNYNNTQKSYGMWMVPPDVGSTVIVIFIDGDPKRGYWIGCVPDENMNFMVPGIAATQNVVEGGDRAPVAEYNKKLNNSSADPTQFKKPKHPLADVLTTQGLLKDDIRGITTSSARRETPSSVFGISTPGPVDKRPGATRGAIGSTTSRVPNAFVSRLGGSTFVMDDGDDKFLRKTKPSDGPPEYAAVEQGETGGLNTIPHNELVRIRTRTGHQILLHNSEDLIYIGNARGTTWIELTSNGKIDIYAADDISMHTKGNFNVTADKDINLTSTGGNVNIKSSGNTNIGPGGNFNVKPGGSANINPGGNCNILAGSTSIDGGTINLNSGTAGGAAAATAATRVPNAEPWAGHENLHGASLKYTTKTDTFNKVKGAD